MDEKFNKFEENETYDYPPVGDTPNTTTNDVNKLSMDDRGNIHTGGGVATMATSARTFLVLGWISAALTAFVSPYFAIAGIVFGVLANRQNRRSGNAVIITNIVLAIVNLLFGLFLVAGMWRLVRGY